MCASEPFLSLYVSRTRFRRLMAESRGTATPAARIRVVGQSMAV